MSRKLEIIIIVLVALGAAAAGAGAAIYFAYPNQVSLVAGETRSYVLSFNQPPGTVKTEENTAFKGAARPAAAAAPGAAAGDWPSFRLVIPSLAVTAARTTRGAPSALA
jgi:hypothetical protein